MSPSPVRADPDALHLPEDDLLFSIETNVDVRFEDVAVTPELARAADAFALGPVEDAAAVRKPSPTSRLWRIETPGGRFILRHVGADLQEQTELQCSVAAAVDFDRFIQPLTNGEGSFTFVDGDGTWMAYPALAGRPFSAREGDPVKVLKAGLDLLDALADVETPGGESAELPRADHQPEAWPALVEKLTDRGWLEDNARISKAFSTGTCRALLANQAPLLNLAEDLAGLDAATGPALVHNDLQHANVLLGDDGPYFLDIEDLVVESREVAATHAAFKLLRHAVYEGVVDVGDVRIEAVPRAVEILGAGGFDVPDPESLFAWGAYRILSEVHEIVDHTVRTGREDYLYDLDKRTLNLFELAAMTRSQPMDRPS